MSESIIEFINEAIRVIELGRRGLMSRDEALDTLWELIMNIDYEVRRRKYPRIEALMN
ncbi:hypothetical protein JCM16161A_23060 [Vulcanisaeta sp. JCM 16161]|uniref:hypothetical protein n=1 Tax=Vulcanisaeta sp. JCM 16161 TaxID=1295372 RepID=UPI000B129959|nr:hypothetical protein [Vulcanisaeta sp. JCM 16161]